MSNIIEKTKTAVVEVVKKVRAAIVKDWDNYQFSVHGHTYKITLPIPEGIDPTVGRLILHGFVQILRDAVSRNKKLALTVEEQHEVMTKKAAEINAGQWTSAKQSGGSIRKKLDKAVSLEQLRMLKELDACSEEQLKKLAELEAIAAEHEG